ncbi:hypothetical protein Dimus_004027 [Dionaea muscipula]
MEASAIPIVSEEGQQKKRCLKKAISMGPRLKKEKIFKLPRVKSQRVGCLLSLSGEPTDLLRVVSSNVPDREAVLDAFGPTTTKLDKEVDELLLGVMQHSFISETLISLNALVQEQRKTDSSGLAAGDSCWIKQWAKSDLKEMKMECDASIKVSEKMKPDVDKVMTENQSLERRNEELQAALEKEKEKVNSLDSRMDMFRDLKMKLDSDLNERKLKNEKLQTELDNARLALTQTVNDDLKREVGKLIEEADKPSSS